MEDSTCWSHVPKNWLDVRLQLQTNWTWCQLPIGMTCPSMAICQWDNNFATWCLMKATAINPIPKNVCLFIILTRTIFTNNEVSYDLWPHIHNYFTNSSFAELCLLTLLCFSYYVLLTEMFALLFMNCSRLRSTYFFQDVKALRTNLPGVNLICEYWNKNLSLKL